MRRKGIQQLDSARATTLWVRAASGRYPVWTGTGVLGQSGRRLRGLRMRLRRVFVVSSPRVWALWGAKLLAGLRAGGVRADFLLMDDREESKRLAAVERLAEELLRRGADRSAVLLALGGGVVGDVTGFLAASYMRGVAYAQVPTTLVAQIDSAIGGKTGVNLRGGKNLVGAFHPPLAVLADLRTLETLPAREYRAGLYEVVKSAVIGDPGLFSYLERRMADVRARKARALRTILHRAIRVKAGIVARDEREQGLRQVLNFGHTVGHALETLGGYRGLRHGEAVGWGMIAATRLAVRLGKLPANDAARILNVIGAVGRRGPLPPASPQRVYAQLFADKKKRHARLRFVLPRGIGRVEIVDAVPRATVLACLRGLRDEPPGR